MDEKDTVVAIISGGLDSTSMLWFLHDKEYSIVETISFDYGQKHVKELDAAKRIVERFNSEFSQNVKHHIVDLRNVGKLIAKGALTGDDEVPAEMYDKESQRITIVPNRNGIMLNIAAGRAVTLGSRFVAYAAHASDYSVYPDCRPEFIEAMDKAIYLGNLWTPVNIIAPFQNMTKREVTQHGLKLGAPLELTWSCYKGQDRPCLECGTCLERTEAFLLNETKDPALSEKEWQSAIQKYEEHKQRG